MRREVDRVNDEEEVNPLPPSSMATDEVAEPPLPLRMQGLLLAAAVALLDLGSRYS